MVKQGNFPAAFLEEVKGAVRDYEGDAIYDYTESVS
jgi:hypothetical protein